MQPRFRLALAATAAAALLAGAPAAAASASPSHHSSWLRPRPSRLYALLRVLPRSPDARHHGDSQGVWREIHDDCVPQSRGTKSCAVDWNSAASQPLTYYNADIGRLRKLGGDVIPSFGGYSADTFGSHDHGAEIADSCTSVQQIAAVRAGRADAGGNPAGHGRGVQRGNLRGGHRRRDEAIAMASSGPPGAASGCRSSSRCRWNPAGFGRALGAAQRHR